MNFLKIGDFRVNMNNLTAYYPCKTDPNRIVLEYASARSNDYLNAKNHEDLVEILETLDNFTGARNEHR